MNKEGGSEREREHLSMPRFLCYDAMRVEEEEEEGFVRRNEAAGKRK